MKIISGLALLILIGSVIVLTQKNLVTNSPPNYWAHRFMVKSAIPYGQEHDQQRLDLYLQGRWSGEPNYFRVVDSPRPTLIHIHGGGWISGDKSDVANWLTHYVERGWNVVNLNYRTGAGSAPAAVTDVMCALKWTTDHAKEYRFDMNRLVIGGFSSGGHLALLAGLMRGRPGHHQCHTDDGLKVKAIINWFGITEIELLAKYLAIHRRPNYPLRWIGDESQIKKFSQQYSPVHFVNANAPATLTIHGDRDTIVPHEQAQLLHKQLDKNGVKNRLFTIAGGTHGGFTDLQYREALTAIFQFLNELAMY